MNFLLGLVLMLIGIVGVVSPQTLWYVSHGWRYKDAEPSEAVLFFNRVGGVIAIIIAAVSLFNPGM